jgi:callose synthase
MSSSRRRRGGGPERAADNWERLVRAALKRDREHLRSGGAAGGLGLAAAVPASLGRTTNIEQILQAADDIEDEDPNVARIRKPQHLSPLSSLTLFSLSSPSPWMELARS